MHVRDPGAGPGNRSVAARNAAITASTVLLAYLAFDDITTDSALSFRIEWTAIAGCAAWFTVASYWLMRQGFRKLGGISLAVVAVAALSQSSINGGAIASTWFARLALLVALAWFAALAAIMVWLAARGTSART
jgi:hypothetical protein